MGDEPLAGGNDPDREATVLRRRLKRERAIRREAERIAERAIARWYEADQVKSALIDTVAHELRTPSPPSSASPISWGNAGSA